MSFQFYKYRKIIILLILSFIFLTIFPLSALAKKNKKKKDIPLTMPSGWNDKFLSKMETGESLKNIIAVLDFEDNDKLAGKVELKLADMLITSLVKTNKFNVIERNKLGKVLEEHKLQAVGLTDPASNAIELGKLVGAENVIFGTVSSATQQKIDKFSYDLIRIEVSIDVRAVNTTTGEIIFSESATGVSDNKIVTTADGEIVSGVIDYNAAYSEASRQAVDKTAEKIATLFPLLGYVINIKDEEIYTDIGSDRGVKIGDTFIIFRKGEEIVHPVTGKLMGCEKEVIGLLEITISEQELSIGKILKTKETKDDDDVIVIKPGDLLISVEVEQDK